MSDVDIVARSMEMKWGVDRLPRLVSKELRDKFRAQKNAFDEAIMSNDAHRIERVGEAMRRAWVALDAAATKDGQTPLSDSIWTAKHPKTGEVVTVIRDGAEIVDVKEAGGRLFTLEELVKFVPVEVMRIKEAFYGCSVVEVKSKQLRDIAAASSPMAALVGFALTEKKLKTTPDTITHWTSLLEAAVEADTGGTCSEEMRPFIDSLGERDRFPAAVAAFGAYIGASTSEARQFLNTADSVIAIRGGADVEHVEESLATLLESEPQTEPEAFAHLDEESRGRRIEYGKLINKPVDDGKELNDEIPF